MKTIFFTGGTGFVGSNLALHLLKTGYRVIFLARGNKKNSAKERIENALNLVDANSHFFNDSYEIVDGDITTLTLVLLIH